VTTEFSTTPALDHVLSQAELRIAALEARLARMERTATSETSAMEEVSSRRGLFKLAGAVATGAIASTMVSATPAAASVAAPFVGLGQSDNSTSSETSVTKIGTAGAALLGTNNSTGAADGVKGVSNGSLGAGINGESTAGFGVYGSSTSGYALFAGGNGRLGIASHVTNGPPTMGTYALGDIIRDSFGNMFACVVGGLDTAAVWRKIAGPTAAGQFHLFSSPLRTYDSRSEAVLAGGAERVVSLAGALPAGANGAMMTLTVTSTTSTGYLSLFATGTPTPTTSNINWFGAGQSLASLTVSAVDSLRRVTVRCGTGSTHFIVDVIGYYA
jgi:hypothetical protein